MLTAFEQTVSRAKVTAVSSLTECAQRMQALAIMRYGDNQKLFGDNKKQLSTTLPAQQLMLPMPFR